MSSQGENSITGAAVAAGEQQQERAAVARGERAAGREQQRTANVTFGREVFKCTGYKISAFALALAYSDVG